MKKYWIFAALLLSFSTFAAEPYFGANFTSVDYEQDGFPTLSPTALTLKLGSQINPNFAVEGRLGVGLSDDTADVTLEVDNYYGLYVKGILPAGPVSPYALLGFTKAKLTLSAPGISVSDDDSSETIGVGIDVPLSKTTALNFEFAKLLDGDGYEVNSMSAGLAVRF